MTKIIKVESCKRCESSKCQGLIPDSETWKLETIHPKCPLEPLPEEKKCSECKSNYTNNNFCWNDKMRQSISIKDRENYTIAFPFKIPSKAFGCNYFEKKEAVNEETKPMA